MKYFRRGIPLLLAMIMLLTQNNTVFAAKTDKSIQKVGGFVVKDITEDEVPEGIQVVEYDSIEDAYAYLENLDKGIETSKSTDGSIIIQSTNGQQKVDSYSVAGVGSINLYVRYVTSGDSNTGKITSASAYTNYTGFTLGFGWTQDNIGYTINSAKTDVYAYCDGTLDYYILVEGGIKYFSRAISLDGWAYCVR